MALNRREHNDVDREWRNLVSHDACQSEVNVDDSNSGSPYIFFANVEIRFRMWGAYSKLKVKRLAKKKKEKAKRT